MTGHPGVAVGEKSLFAIDKSAIGLRTSLSVAELLPGTGSVTPGATVAATVFTSVPTAAGATVAEITNVADPPASRSTTVLRFPEPPARHVEPLVARHVHVAPVNAAGIASTIVTLCTSDGPSFVATIVYWIGKPGVDDATASVFVIATSATRTIDVVSVAELFDGVGSIDPTGIETVAVLDSVPAGAPDATVPETAKVALPPDASVTSSEMSPEPAAFVHEDPVEAAHVHVAPVNADGMVSLTKLSEMVEGPAFVTMIEYVSASPAAIDVRPSVFVTMRSAVGVTDVVSVAALSSGDVSATPAGAAIVAEFAITPDAEAPTVATTVNDALPAGSSETAVLIALPAPDPGHEEPTVAAQVHEMPVSDAGATSLNGAATTDDGPAFDTTI
jgi:hypothetical protein